MTNIYKSIQGVSGAYADVSLTVPSDADSRETFDMLYDVYRQAVDALEAEFAKRDAAAKAPEMPAEGSGWSDVDRLLSDLFGSVEGFSKAIADKGTSTALDSIFTRLFKTESEPDRCRHCDTPKSVSKLGLCGTCYRWV
jgi:hypothetical protein